MPNFNHFPAITISTPYTTYSTWESIFSVIDELLNINYLPVLIDCYHGVLLDDLISMLVHRFPTYNIVDTRLCMHDSEFIKKMVYNDVTDDRIFGKLTELTLSDYFDSVAIRKIQREFRESESLTIIVGPGATFLSDSWCTLIYADMARWEIQLRQRKGLVDNLGVLNKEAEDWMPLYKQGYFVDWRVLDKYKTTLFNSIDYLLDTNSHNEPKMVSYAAILEAYDTAITQPFSVVPFFDPGPWGGQWMKEKFSLPENGSNYAWCFNCVPEENSLLIQIGDTTLEIPSINLVFRHPKPLLGEYIFNEFGAEFPIRFDYLDTMKGGNLSLQVHPSKDYIKQHFNMDYTQDESYYIMDADEDAFVYLGFKDGINDEHCIQALNEAQKGLKPFDADTFVAKWPAKKHDHFLIPAGTIHCSGTGCMVLEISATPYIFTFKLWDWGRLGLDGKPRPINISHGKNVLDWSRTSKWTKNNLISDIEAKEHASGWEEEKTGLHSSQFIETRRHWFTRSVTHYTKNTLIVVAVIEGDQVVVESPTGVFKPFIANYGEVFIIPATIDEYTISPIGNTSNKCGTLKAYVRNES